MMPLVKGTHSLWFEHITARSLIYMAVLLRIKKWTTGFRGKSRWQSKKRNGELLLKLIVQWVLGPQGRYANQNEHDRA
jgi:hypothetical protein